MSKVSVLLASYGPQSQRYLDLCYKSLEAQTYQDFEVIHVSSGEFCPTPIPRAKHHHVGSRLHYPGAVAKAYQESNPESEFILFLNDDVILNKFALERLIRASGLGNLMINPMSNCDDNGRSYVSLMEYKQLQYRIDEMEAICDKVIQDEHHYPFLLFSQEIAHLYCTLIRRDDYERIGRIDTSYLTGFDDRDLSVRAKKLGILPVVAADAYCLHGSGVTADIYLTTDERKFNQQYFLEKFKEELHVPNKRI
jgi:GT2 family glycosyltransferase